MRSGGLRPCLRQLSGALSPEGGSAAGRRPWPLPLFASAAYVQGAASSRLTGRRLAGDLAACLQVALRSLSGEYEFLANFITLYANGTPSGCYRRTEGWRFPRSQSPGHASVSRRVRKTWRNWPEIPRMAANRRDEALRSSTGRLCLSQVGASPASQAIPPGAASRVASSQRLGRPRRWWGQLPASREAMTAPLRTPWGGR